MTMGAGRKKLATSIALAAGTLLLAAAAFASGGGEGAHHVDRGAQMKDFVWRVVDFALLAGIIWWALKKANLKGSLTERQAGIERALKEAEQARAEADRKLTEYSERLKKANEEIDQLQAAVRQEAQDEKARIIAEANAMADKIRQQATASAAQEVAQAKAALRDEAARLALELAEQTLKEKVTGEDQSRLVGEYLSKVVNIH
jgi:F-type H+-transporting ATPase subunit b